MTEAADIQLHEGVELFGISYKTAPLDVLERLALAPDEVTTLYQQLFRHDGVRDALVLSTCNRTEVYTVSASGVANDAVQQALSEIAGTDRFPDSRYLYDAHGRAGIEHLFRVACGLDSMIVGEAQILGQVKNAFDASRRHRPPSDVFTHVMQSAFRVARRSRSDTEIGRGAVSVASAAVHLGTRIYGDLSRRTVAVLGAGDTGRLVAEHFIKHGPNRLAIINRSRERAEAIARELGGMAFALDELPRVIREVDILACAVRAPAPPVTLRLVEAAMRERSDRALAILDLGLPRNVAAEVNKIANVFVHDLEALQRVVDSNLTRRRKEIPHVERLIRREIDRLLAWQNTAQAEPLIVALRTAMETIRRSEVEKATSGLTDVEREAVERATRAVLNKLLHGPMASIKEFARQQEEGAEQLQVIRKVFSNLKLDV